MSSIKDYLENLIKSINPTKYSFLSEQIPKNAIKFFIFTLTFAILISNILFIPNLIRFNDEMISSISEFDELKLNVEFKTSNPININLINGQTITIDSKNNVSKDETNYLITENKYYYNQGKNANYHDKILNLKNNENAVKKLLIIFTLLILPTIAIIYYTFRIVLFFILIAIISLIINMSFNRPTKKKSNKKLKYIEILNCGLYSSPILGIKIILENITRFSSIMYPIWISFFMICIISIKFKLESKKQKN